WMIRELGKNISETTEFITRHQDRIIFGTDLHVGTDLHANAEPVEPNYFATRFWSHRTFWETSTSTTLPFDDPDAPFGVTFTGLALPQEILEKMYYHNFMRLFRS
ncbi:MAG: hypothetical protein ACW99Q_13090, partial [Candidatus Kariarchaeaceae archaeon]